MSCSQVRLEMLQLFAFGEELGPRSGPHLAHLATCAECRQELAIDRGLVKQLRLALRERVDGGAPSAAASWELVRRRTVDRPAPPWTLRTLPWGGMVSAAAAGIMMFVVVTAPEARLSAGTQPPVLNASLAARSLVSLEEAGDWAASQWSTRGAAETDLPPKGWTIRTQPPDDGSTNQDDPTFPGRMR